MREIEISECAIHSRNPLPRERHDESDIKTLIQLSCFHKVPRQSLGFACVQGARSLATKGCRLAAYLSHCLIWREIFTGCFCTSYQFSKCKQNTNVPEKYLLNTRRWFALFEGSSWPLHPPGMNHWENPWNYTLRILWTSHTLLQMDFIDPCKHFMHKF
jgi:hypothetical protein